MAIQFYRLLGHSAVAADGFTHSSDLIIELKNGGTTKGVLTQAAEILHLGESLIERKTEKCGEDRIREHGLHFATSEAEMWLETIASKLRGKTEKENISKILGREMHTHDHATTVIAQVIRALSSIATDPETAVIFGDDRQIKDTLMRGNAALARLIKTGEIKMRAKEEQQAFKIFREIDAFQVNASNWIRSLESAAANIQTPQLCGWLGLVPKGTGVQYGGASFAVELHGRGQTKSPNSNVYPCTGWSIGRQGNSENMGPGFIK